MTFCRRFSEGSLFLCFLLNRKGSAFPFRAATLPGAGQGRWAHLSPLPSETKSGSGKVLPKRRSGQNLEKGLLPGEPCPDPSPLAINAFVGGRP